MECIKLFFRMITMVLVIGIANQSDSNNILAKSEDVAVNKVYEAQPVQCDERYIYTTKPRDKGMILDTYPNLHVEAILDEGNRMLLFESYLILIKADFWPSGSVTQKKELGTVERNKTTLTIYNIEDRKAPKIIRSIAVEGELLEIRRKESQIYFVTRIGSTNKMNQIKVLNDFLPAYEDSKQDDQLNLLPLERVYNVKNDFEMRSAVNVIGSFDLKSNSNLDMIAIVGGKEEIYIEDNKLFLSSVENDNVRINRVEFTTKGIQYKGSVTLPYSVFHDKIQCYYEKNFLATAIISDEDEQFSCNLYMIDDQMKQVGKYTFQCESKGGYNISFIENKMYIRNVETLVAVIDLSNPTQLVKASDMSLPDVMNELYPIGTGLAVEISHMQTHTQNIGEWGVTYNYFGPGGVKIKLFDTSNKAPKKLDELIVGLQSTAVHNEYTAVVNKESNILALPVVEIDGDLRYEEKAYVFKVEKNKLVQVGKLEQIKTYKGIYITSEEDYIFSVGNKLFYFYNNEISEYNINDLKYIGNMVIE